MATLKHIRNRIKSFKATGKITSAMKMVATSKYKRHSVLFSSAKETFDVAEHVFARLGGWRSELQDHLFFQEKRDIPPLYVVFTPDRGLCGGLSSSIIKAVRHESFERIKVIGKKGFSIIKPNHNPITIHKFQDVEVLTKDLLKAPIGTIFCVRPVFYNILTSKIVIEKIFPLELPAFCDQEGSMDADFIDSFLRYYIASKLWLMNLELTLCEHASRMVAMDYATRNASTFIAQLEKTYNTTRQAQITKELIEIVSGAAEV